MANKILKYLKDIHHLLKHYSYIIKLGLGTDDSRYLKNCDVLFICHDVDRSANINGLAYSPLCDSIREDFEMKGLDCLSVAHYGSKLTGKNGYGFPLAINRKFLCYLILERVFILFSLDSFFTKPSFYEYLLNETTPKIVIAIGSTDSLCREARKKNILSVELLHGTGYQFIPWGWDIKEPICLPKVILSLDDISTEALAPLIDHGISIFTIPNPFLKRFLPDRLELLPKEWKPLNVDGFKKRILITLSWGYSGDHGKHLEFSNILKNGILYEELVEIIKELKDVFWHIRLHPVQMQYDKYIGFRQNLDSLVMDNKNCEWKNSSSLPFPVIAANCSGNISMASMSCYDAAAMGVPSLLLCPTIQPGGVHEDWFENLVKEGYVTKNKVDKKRLQNWVQSVEKIEPRLSNLNDEDSWENAVEWLLSKSGWKSS